LNFIGKIAAFLYWPEGPKKKVEVLGGVKFLGPVVYNQEGMQWYGHILYITPGGGGKHVTS
jgi:hypothetical protein